MQNTNVSLNSSQRGFFQEIESLRGLAALAVVIEHCFWFFFETKPGIFNTYPGVQPITHWLIHTVFSGRASVLLFFIMSGFVLGLQLKNETASLLIGWPTYVVRRVLRIVPAMWVSVFVSYGVALLTGSPSNADIAMLVRTLFFWDFFLQVPLWSINIEMGCSLVFPLLYFISTRTGKITNLAVFVLLMAMIFIVPMPPWDLRVEFMRSLVLFHAGLIVGEYGTTWMTVLGRLRWPLFWGALLGFGLIPQLWIFQSTFMFFADRRWTLLAEIPFCFFILSYVVHERGQPGTALLRQAWARYLGKVSYSLFLFHWPVLVIVQFYLLTDMSPGLSAIVQRYPLAVQGVLFAVVLSISLVVASASYRWVEKPFIELGRIFGRFVKAKSRKNLMPTEAGISVVKAH
ncbi:acyltransferase family protein [Undibacterium sp. Di26W]|uniref:acyltransferase family protein n=1 Tax=Undibacterium sp. Di26W TaxID=3413035 RepID=UPI003BF239C4